MSFPAHFLEHLNALPGFSSPAFEAAHVKATPTSIRINPFKPAAVSFDASPIPWSREGGYLAVRPSFTFDPLFHAGAYYVQEASSQLLEQAVLQHVGDQQPIRALDLCAAPGGKSTHLLSLIGSDGLLVSNEVIRTRSGILADNLNRWGCAHAVVTQLDPSVIGQLSGFFDLMVVDAPCSGSGLFRKDPDAMDHWSLSAVDHCAARQQRILADSWPALKTDGVLVYSTCSYSEAEDEQIVAWIQSELGAELLPLSLPSEWGIVETNGGYRCWPHRVKGEGFFMAVFRKVADSAEYRFRKTTVPEMVGKTIQEQVNTWWQQEQGVVYAWKDGLWGFPVNRSSDLEAIFSIGTPLRIGTRLGEWIKSDLIPDHALALSRDVSGAIPRVELDEAESIRYLQRGAIERAGLERGWMLVTYRSLPMGWIKSLGNRINNYYPAHLRILKQSPGPGAGKNAQL